MIKLENVGKKYEDGSVAIKRINMQCEEGEITVLIGPSGCGKTTTLQLLNRLIDPTSGNIFIDGKDSSQVNRVNLRRKIGYVIQSIGLFPHMTISKNVAVVPKLLKWDKDHTQKKVKELLDLVGLDPDIYSDRFPDELSGGQQQRIGVIRALAAEPSIILMDEPFSALDPISREQLQDELVKLQKDIKKTIVFVTHDMDEALKIADKIVLMKDGHVIQQGRPQDILRNPADEFVKNFIGQKRLNEAGNIPVAADIMDEDVATVTSDQGLTETLDLMESRQRNQLVVVHNDHKLAGYISVFDVVEQMKRDHQSISAIIHPFEQTVGRNTLLTEAISMINEYELSMLPVIDNGVLVGLLRQETIIDYIEDAGLFGNGGE